jgi:hypothetical protein
MKSPPSLPALLLARRLSPEWREYVLGDLEEEFVAWSRHPNRQPLLRLALNEIHSCVLLLPTSDMPLVF